MPWNSTVEQEYDALLSGKIGDVLGYSGLMKTVAIIIVKSYLQGLETGSATLNLSPANHTYLSATERAQLHLMRVACALYTERMGIWPWSLEDWSHEQLRPLLHLDHQGLHPYTPPGISEVHYVFHGIWDVSPQDRMSIAVLGWVFLALFGELPSNDREFVLNMISNMRSSGWRHMTGYYDVYVEGGYLNHNPSGVGTYSYDDVSSVKQGGCHTTSNYIVATLRAFNIPAHVGYGAGEDLHRSGHCFVHYASLNWWMAHGDDVYNRLMKTLPPEYAMRSDSWVANYQKDASDYVHLRARAHDDYLWWCLLLGQSPTFNLDVRDLYFAGLLRDRLENLHIDLDLAAREGAPSSVPPVFSAAEVDAMMSWVEAKLGSGGG